MSIEVLEEWRFTIEGAHIRRLNPDRRWWQFWKPQWVVAPDLQEFVVVPGEVTTITL